MLSPDGGPRPLSHEGYDLERIAVNRSLADPEVMQEALRARRLLLTQDRDFGALIIKHCLPTHGVILVRDAGMSVQDMIDGLLKLLREPEETFVGNITVLDQRGVRQNNLDPDP